MRGIDKLSHVYEELVDMCSIKCTLKVEDIFKNIENSFEKLGLLLKKLTSITNDGYNCTNHKLYTIKLRRMVREI